MTNEQESYFGMTLKVKNFQVKKALEIAGVPAVAPFFSDLNHYIDDLIIADAGSRADLTGYAIAKSVKRQELERLGLKISVALCSYSVVNNDVVLRKRADFPSSRWYSFSEEELVTQATIIKNLAQPLSAVLDPFGADATDVTAIGTTLNDFITIISDPTLAIDQRKNDNIEVELIIDRIRTLFADKLDVLMRSFEVNNNSLFALYRSARAIDVNGSVHAPTVDTVVLQNSSVTVYEAPAYEANTFYTLQNKGSQIVHFSLSSVDNVDGPEAVMLSPGETRSRLAENLASSGVFLVVKNSTADPVNIRVWVE